MNEMMFEKREDGRIRFNDTSRIDFYTWQKFLIQLNHLGYGFEDETQVRTYFDRGTWINLDQSQAVLYVLRGEKPEDLFSHEQIKNDINKAKKHFGLTMNYDVAGYLLPDGTCLDFSDGQPIRCFDHRSIHEAISDSLPETYKPAYPMIQFMNYGCIRLMKNGIDLVQIPTLEQKETLKRIISQNKTFYVDISNNAGHTVKSFVYDPVIHAGNVLRDINEYFESLKY